MPLGDVGNKNHSLFVERRERRHGRRGDVHRVLSTKFSIQTSIYSNREENNNRTSTIKIFLVSHEIVRIIKGCVWRLLSISNHNGSKVSRDDACFFFFFSLSLSLSRIGGHAIMPPVPSLRWYAFDDTRSTIVYMHETAGIISFSVKIRFPCLLPRVTRNTRHAKRTTCCCAAAVSRICFRSEGGRRRKEEGEKEMERTKRKKGEREKVRKRSRRAVGVGNETVRPI